MAGRESVAAWTRELALTAEYPSDMASTSRLPRHVITCAKSRAGPGSSHRPGLSSRQPSCGAVSPQSIGSPSGPGFVGAVVAGVKLTVKAGRRESADAPGVSDDMPMDSSPLTASAPDAGITGRDRQH